LQISLIYAQNLKQEKENNDLKYFLSLIQQLKKKQRKLEDESLSCTRVKMTGAVPAEIPPKGITLIVITREPLNV
jgi:hypothetical protein